MDNYVGLLNDYAQKNSWRVHFEVVDTQGPAHIKTFTMRAVVNGKSYPDGVGSNKKEAKQNAAKNALGVLENAEPVDLETNSCPTEAFPKLTQVNYTCWLNEYSQKNRVNFSAIERTKMSSGSSVQQCLYVCRYVCDGKEFPQAIAKGKKEAKEAAAKKVYEILIEGKNDVPDENSNATQTFNMSNLSRSLTTPKPSPNAESTTENYIGLLNQYCQQNNQVSDIKLVERSGPAHCPEFVYRVVMNKMEYPEGRGRTAKEAKQKAAGLALNLLQDQSEQSNQSSLVWSVSEDESQPQTSSSEPEDDTRSLRVKTQSTDSFIVFKDSSVSSPHASNPVPKPSPSDVKPKIRLAANFQNSPNRNNEGTPGMTDHNKTKSSTPASNSSTKSRFLTDFGSISKIGKGGFGHVFKARHSLENNYYAVKIVKCTSKSLREVGALSKLLHTNIVRYYTCWTEETAYMAESVDSCSNSGSASMFLYIQMEFCEGKTLRSWINERNFNSKQSSKRSQEASKIMRQVLEAVKYVHSENLIHRDLKPANIMFGNEGAVKVGDFGLATAAEIENDEGLLERTKRTGTRSYMSPEQTNESSYDRKVDIFALGLIFFELLWSFGTVSEKEKLWPQIRSKELPQGFSEKFRFENTLIDRMLCARPEDRPDASELLTKLDWNSGVVQREHNANRENRTY